MSKFIRTIAGSGDSIKLARATAVANSAEIAQKALVNSLEASLNRLEVQLGQLTDLAPESGDSLRPGAGFEATRWVAAVQATNLEIRQAVIALDTAKATYAEWFGAEAATA